VRAGARREPQEGRCGGVAPERRLTERRRRAADASHSPRRGARAVGPGVVAQEGSVGDQFGIAAVRGRVL